MIEIHVHILFTVMCPPLPPSPSLSRSSLCVLFCVCKLPAKNSISKSDGMEGGKKEQTVNICIQLMSCFDICSQNCIVSIVGPADDVHTAIFTLPMTRRCIPLWNGQVISWRFDKAHLKRGRNQFNVREIGKQLAHSAFALINRWLHLFLSFPLPLFFLSLWPAALRREIDWLRVCEHELKSNLLLKANRMGLFLSLLSLFWNISNVGIVRILSTSPPCDVEVVGGPFFLFVAVLMNFTF